MNKLTPDSIEALIDTERYMSDRTLTVCVLRLTNGATVTGESNCIDPQNYDAEVGANVARENAKSKIWELEGYACKTRGFPNDAD